VDVPEFTSEPVVPERLIAGPLLLPGWPGTPAPEFGVVGVTESRSCEPGLVVCAIALNGIAAIKSANMVFCIGGLHGAEYPAVKTSTCRTDRCSGAYEEREPTFVTFRSLGLEVFEHSVCRQRSILQMLVVFYLAKFHDESELMSR
jgi:hypothetical protein